MNRPRRRFDDDDDEDDDKNLFYRPASSKMLCKSPSEITKIEEVAEEPAGATEQKSRYCLPYLQAVLFATILEDCITQLRILAQCNNELRIMKTVAEIDKHRAKKYQIKHEGGSQDLIGINTKNLGLMQYKLDKLAADREYCTEVMLGTYLDLSLNRCYSTITDSNKDIAEREVYRINLAEEEARNRVYRRDLLKQLRQQRNHIKSIAYDTDLIVDKLRSQVEDAALNAETRGRYIVNWQIARTEQHAQLIRDKEAGPSNEINYYRVRSEYEQRVHSEVELLVNIFINETLNKVEMWMNKYDTDMEAVDFKIQIQKNKYQDEISRRMEMEQTIAEHKVLMQNWIEFKKNREQARLYKEKMTKSAIIVQAWWRGLLVRLELGPYKPKRRPPPKPAGGKKK